MLRNLFMLLLGLFPSLLVGVLVLLSSSADQNAADALARFQSAPVCGPSGPGADCREEIAASVANTYNNTLMRSVEPHVVVAAGDQTWDLVPISGTLSLAPGQPVQVERWQGQVVVLRSPDGRTLETQDHPALIRDRNAGTSGLAKLAGVLGLLWAIVFLGIFTYVTRNSPRIERPDKRLLGLGP